VKALDRYAWAAGVLFVAAIVAESVVSIGVAVDQADSAAKLRGVIATFGLVVDGVGFVLLLVFVLSSSVIRIARERPA
jgi:hypothetical protein